MNQNAFRQNALSQPLAKKEIASSSDRLFCLDLLKAISISAAVSYHAIFVPRETYLNSISFLDLSAGPLRFCVPVFFTISFLLLEKGMERPGYQSSYQSGHQSGHQSSYQSGYQSGYQSSYQADYQILKKRMIRLAIPTFFWFSLMAILKLSAGRTMPDVALAIANGTIFHGAYYLLVLFQLIPLSLLLRGQLKHDKAVGFTVLLQGAIFLAVYFILLQANQFSGLLTALRIINRPLLFYWLIYAALGIYFWQHWSEIVDRSRRIAASTKLALLGAGIFLMLAERSLLFTVSKGEIQPFDYNMVSCILITPMILLFAASVQKEDLPSPVSNFILLASRYSLGIFCINGILSEVFLSIGSRITSDMAFGLLEILLIKLGGWIVLFLISLRLSMLLDRMGLGAVVR